MSIREVIQTEIAEPYEAACNKVTIVGTGAVGTRCAFHLISRNIASEICLIGEDNAELYAELADLQHCAAVQGKVKVKGGTDFSLTVCSRVCILAAGVRRKNTEYRESFAQRNAEIFKEIIPKLMLYNRYTVLLVVTSPVDVMTYIAWKLSGLPKYRVIGSGTSVETSIFRYILSTKFEIDPTHDMAYVIGEHYDRCIPYWTGANIAGTHFHKLEDFEDQMSKISKEVCEMLISIKARKGQTCWGVSGLAASITSAILKNLRIIMPVTISVQDIYDIKEDVFLSLPCVLTANGVSTIVKPILSKTEMGQFQTSAKVLQKFIDEIEL